MYSPKELNRFIGSLPLDYYRDSPYDNILVKSSITVAQDVVVAVTTTDAAVDDEIRSRIQAILTELLAVRKSRKLNELTVSDMCSAHIQVM